MSIEIHKLSPGSQQAFACAEQMWRRIAQSPSPPVGAQKKALDEVLMAQVRERLGVSFDFCVQPSRDVICNVDGSSIEIRMNEWLLPLNRTYYLLHFVGHMIVGHIKFGFPGTIVEHTDKRLSGFTHQNQDIVADGLVLKIAEAVRPAGKDLSNFPSVYDFVNGKVRVLESIINTPGS